ncbi:flagellar biosynthetic protein FliR [Parachitinimonas caeni]|uniref:Flagellar biosynthetic protein FliR n=1 Tax=Parachitinimonas caeni TaxID=3031301 RepID=A0ABT7E2H6_9NEIS|nr:flagellar biosynthetic protein FliR [Parachitinimonas caeni]MDK2125112.1 flagellar biosynthetic protein FliR [Parachitinimonas caeni]
MIISTDMAWIVSVFLCFVRISAALIMTPVFGGFSIPVNFRVLLMLALAALLVSGGIANVSALKLSAGVIIEAAVAEFITGILLAYGVFVAFAIFSFGGKLLDSQVGFGIGGLIDPVTRAPSPVLASAIDIFAIVFFFTANIHHFLIKGLKYSFEMVPLGVGLRIESADLALRQFGLVFISGFSIAAPVIFLLLLIDIGLAVLSRNLPQFNVFMISVPIKIVAGLALLAASLHLFFPLINKIFYTIPRYFESLIG